MGKSVASAAGAGAMDRFLQARSGGELDMDALDRASRSAVLIEGIEATLAMIQALGDISYPEWADEEYEAAEGALTVALESPVPEVRDAAREALTRIGS